ncbi:LLM class flavin-dependent oxidoreductase [Tsukamurella sp. 8F]|uniref:LLM class flavin-dependent oxidoreductase n=1 Tax=unclassified Tsukamurella TaxID=2633480 RepID=UPI0023B8E9EC|nr:MULTISPECIES: LLM class flavin-dependent oxidoreductase [unclassified Tsukamurella]MDF0531358.1 LLM class flavin-dependent oxidoreductase [Tsukamurella sp. 8J]MDF0588564.1 LLM class flavin-dependent oxidoreductase [Tsukamurella sp. 8F]
MTRPLHLALEIDGAGAQSGAGVRAVGAVAENAGFTFVTIDDSLTPAPAGPAVRLDAVVRAAFLARTTSRLGIVPLAHPATTEPFHLASQLAALDHATEGRAGWLVGSVSVPDAAAALDRPVPADGAALTAEIADVVEVAQRLWDSWEDDAVVRDTASGRYIDRERLHYVDFESTPDGRPGFSVKGPLIVPRGPQGRPVVVARHGTVPNDLIDIVLVAPDAAQSRSAAGPKVFVDLPFALAGHGSAATLTDQLRRLHGQVDGVRLVPADPAADVPLLVRDVLPPLRVERRTATPRPGATLRDTLGLARPTNRYATSGSIR